MSKIVRSALAVGALLLGVALMAPLAASATNSANATVAASATVVANCKITTSPIAFGAYDPLIANNSLAAVGQAPETVYCTKGSYPNVNVSSSSGVLKVNPSDATGLNYTYSLGAPNFGTHSVISGYQTVVTGTYQYPEYQYQEYCVQWDPYPTVPYCFIEGYQWVVVGYGTGYNYGQAPVYTQVANASVSSGIANGITWMLNATLPGGQDAPVGVYQDTVTVTLNF